MPTPLISAEMELLGGLPTTVGGWNGTGWKMCREMNGSSTSYWSYAAVFQVPRQYSINC